MQKLKKSNESLKLSDRQKEQMIKKAERAYGKFLNALGFDYANDEHMKGTPYRVAKMYVRELFSGVYDQDPVIKAFDNTDQYNGMVFEAGITVRSTCAHHHLPFIGVAHVAYIPSPTGKVLGLSKLNRIVDYFSRRPQVQENLTVQIKDYLNEVIGDNGGVAVMIEAKHMCANVRGVKDKGIMITSEMTGAFKENIATRDEFLHFVASAKNS